MEKIPYKYHYPSAARMLIEEGICSPPRQHSKTLGWADGIDIIYTLNMKPAEFAKYADTLLLLAYQEAMRYNNIGRWKFAGFEVKLGRLPKGKDLPDIQTYQAAMHDDPEIMVYGPGYEVPQRYFLKDKVADILDIAKRYQGKIKTQSPFRIIRLFISIRQPWIGV